MGRGLSELQKCILRLALANVGGRDAMMNLSAEVRYEDIRKKYYRVKQSTNTVEAAITRAVNRLVTRGLVTAITAVHSRWSGANLTDEGRRVAAELTVNKKMNSS